MAIVITVRHDRRDDCPTVFETLRFLPAVNKYPAYQAQDISTSSPLRLVVRLYDVAIASCHRDDRSKLRAALTELIAALNFDEGGDISARLYRLYEYCMDQSVAGDLDEVRAILEGLREAWRTVSVAEAA